MIPPVDERRIAGLVKSRCEEWRHSPTGIPAVLVAEEWEWFELKLGLLSESTRATIARLWAMERRRCRGGAHGVTTFDHLPDDGDDLLARFDRSRFGRGGNQ